MAKRRRSTRRKQRKRSTSRKRRAKSRTRKKRTKKKYLIPKSAKTNFFYEPKINLLLERPRRSARNFSFKRTIEPNWYKEMKKC